MTVVGIGGSYLGPEFVTSAIGTSLSESVRRLEVRFVVTSQRLNRRVRLEILEWVLEGARSRDRMTIERERERARTRWRVSSGRLSRSRDIASLNTG